MKIMKQFFLVTLGVGLLAACKARVNGGDSMLRDAGNLVFTSTYSGQFIQDVPNSDIAGMEQGNVDAEYGRFVLTFSHNNQTEPELNDAGATGPDEPVEAFGTVQNSGKTLILSMGRGVNLATTAGSNRPEWRGSWTCLEAFAMVEERNPPDWGKSDTAACTVGFTGNGPISAGTREGSFVFGIKAN